MVLQPVALMQRPEGETNASARTSGLFADRSPGAAALSPRNPLGAMAAAGARRKGFVASLAAAGSPSAAWGAANPILRAPAAAIGPNGFLGESAAGPRHRTANNPGCRAGGVL